MMRATRSHVLLALLQESLEVELHRVFQLLVIGGNYTIGIAVEHLAHIKNINAFLWVKFRQQLTMTLFALSDRITLL